MSRSVDLYRRVLSSFFEKNAEKLTDKCDLSDSGVDSGIISSENLMFSGEISEEIIPEQHQHRRGDARSQSDSGIIEDSEKKTSESMHIDSGICLISEPSLSEKISKLNLGSNNLDNPKVLLPPVEYKKAVDDVPWNICYEQDEDGDTLLHTAIFHGYAQVTLDIIRIAPHPRLLDTPNDAAQTPLHLAVQTGQFPVVRWLIVAGAKPCPRDSQGDSPLHVAVRMGRLNCVRAITDPVSSKHKETIALGYILPPYEKPKLDQWNYIGQTCVHVAAKHKRLEILKHLVACGADINAREGLEGLTALHYAVKNGDDLMIKYLLTECRTLDPNITTYGGRNALQWYRNVPPPIRRFLKMRGLDSPYSSEEEDSSSEDEEMTYDSQLHRFSPNLVNASA